MENLKTMFLNKFPERELPFVFHKVYWSKIIAEVCAMKIECFKKNNIKQIN